jgi:diaminopimelate decarboxylase
MQHFGKKQRTGLKIKQLKEISEFLKNQSVTPHSFHVYCGTGSSLKKIKKYLIRSLKVYRDYFPNVKEINLGGGFAFDYKSLYAEKKHFDWNSYFAYLKQKIKDFDISPEVRFILEPGRDIFADIGVQILKVKRVINYPNAKSVSTDGSYVFIPSAAKRNRKHNLDFYDQNFDPIAKKQCFYSKLSGSTTLSSDYIMPDAVHIPGSIKESDYIVVKDLGAYGATQHMEFLNKKPCAEILIDSEGKLKLITTEGEETDKTRYALLTPKLL